MQPIKRLNPKEPPLGFEEIGTCNKCDSPVWKRVSIVQHVSNASNPPIFNCMCHLSPVHSANDHKEQKAIPKVLDVKRIESKPKNFYF